MSLKTEEHVHGPPVEMDGRLFVSAADELHGTELWVSDHTSDGTVLLADINPGPADSDRELLTVVGDRLFFAADADSIPVHFRQNAL